MMKMKTTRMKMATMGAVGTDVLGEVEVEIKKPEDAG